MVGASVPVTRLVTENAKSRKGSRKKSPEAPKVPKTGARAKSKLSNRIEKIRFGWNPWPELKVADHDLIRPPWNSWGFNRKSGSWRSLRVAGMPPPPCFCPLRPCQDRKKRLQATKLTDMDKQVNARLFINFLSNRIFFDFFGIVSVSWANPASVAHLLPAGRAVTFLNPSTKVCKFSYWILIPKILKWLDSSCWAIVSNPIESNYSIIYRIEFFD